nr:hypothetical protein [Tanacetum cinerariifolium]
MLELRRTIEEVFIVQNNVQQEVAGEVALYPPMHEDVAEEVIEMANDQAKALSDQEMTDECLDNKQELAAARNSNNLNDAMPVYIQREINADLQFAVGLSQLWDVLYNRVNEMKMLSSELNLFGVPFVVQCAEYLKQLSQTEALRMLELRRTIEEVHI